MGHRLTKHSVSSFAAPKHNCPPMDGGGELQVLNFCPIGFGSSVDLQHFTGQRDHSDQLLQPPFTWKKE